MNTRQCPYCHEDVPVSEFSSHCREHEKLRPDGQQQEYVTLPPELRSHQSLEEEPQVYEHRVCGAATGMPEEIVRSYLVNPYLYLATGGWGRSAGVRFVDTSGTVGGSTPVIARRRFHSPGGGPRLTSFVSLTSFLAVRPQPRIK